MRSFWDRVNGPDLAQGDFLPHCLVPLFKPELDANILQLGSETIQTNVEVGRRDLIVVTQSCDLENEKINFVALCPIITLDDFSKVDPNFKNRARREEVRRGRHEGLHMLGCPFDPSNNAGSLVVDFRQIHSFPFEYLKNHAEQLGDRWRLESPFLEHFSQAFARFFMRVGLPSAIAPFK